MLKNSKGLLKLVVLAMLIALGVVISPLLRFEGMCPMAHFINILCSVLLGPWYSLLCATLIGIIRMIFMAIPPIALTGAIFGAFLSGVFYRVSKGNLLMAVLGEIIGTGIIGAVLSYPVMTIFWGRTDLNWVFYVPSFICGTLIGGSIAYVFLRKIAKAGILEDFQKKLSDVSYGYNGSLVGDAATVCGLGVIGFLVIEILSGLFALEVSYISYSVLAVFIVSGIAVYIRGKKNAVKTE